MASRNVIFQRVSDEMGRTAVAITVDTGTPDADPQYSPDSLVDENPARVAKINSTTGSFLFDFNGVKAIIQIAAIIHHTLDAGLDVRIEGNNTNSWVTPSFVAPIVIPASLGLGTTKWPVNPWVDLTTVTPLSGAYDATGFKFWRIHIVGTNSQNIQIGQSWFGTLIRNLNPNIEGGFTRNKTKPVIDNVTSFGVSTIYSRQTTQWAQSASIIATAAVDAALDTQWFDVDGRSHPFLLIPDGTINEAYLVRWQNTTQDQQFPYVGITPRSVVIQEVSRGLRPGV